MVTGSDERDAQTMSAPQKGKGRTRQRPSKISTIESTAYHEAGHVVADIALRQQPRHVTIEPNQKEGSLGHVAGRRFPKEFQPDVAISSRGRDIIERRAIGFLAGVTAAREAGGAGRGGRGDFDKAVDLVSFLAGDPDICGSYVELLRMRAVKLIRSHWPAVEAVAQALLRERRLSGQAARAIALDADQRLPRPRRRLAGAKSPTVLPRYVQCPKCKKRMLFYKVDKASGRDCIHYTCEKCFSFRMFLEVSGGETVSFETP